MSLIELTTAAADAPTWTPAGEIVITSADHYVAVAEQRKTIRAFLGRVETFFAPLKRKAQEAHKALVAEEQKALAPAQADLAAHDRAMRAWDDAQERARREEQRRLEELARQAEADRRLAEAAALEREAAQTGDVELRAEAEALISAPIEAPVVILPPATPKVAGVSYRETWDFEITDVALIPREFLAPDVKAIGGVVRAMKGATKIPGVRVFSKKTVVTR